jgi:hypothetical protein
MGWLVPLDQFSFRLQPIFEVITNQSAVGTVNLVRAIHNFFDPQRLADRISVKYRFLQFKLSCDFAS